MRALVAAFSTLAIVATLALASAGAAATSGLRGTVMRGPVTPVCAAESPCDAPAKHVAVIFMRNGISHTATTDANGHYRIALAPGTYVVRIAAGRSMNGSKTVLVPVGRYGVRNFSIDTGIR